MIGLETAQNLKDAGLKWEPKLGDFLYYKSFSGDISDGIGIIESRDIEKWGKRRNIAKTAIGCLLPASTSC